MNWTGIEKWKKGAIIGFLIGAIFFTIFSSAYNFQRQSHQECLQTLERECITSEGKSVDWAQQPPETCTLKIKAEEAHKCENGWIYPSLSPLHAFYEFYMTLNYYYLGLGQLNDILRENNTSLLNLVTFVYNGIPSMIIGLLVGFLLGLPKKRKRKRKRKYRFFAIVFIFLILPSFVLSYKMSPGVEVHQKITKESEEVWNNIPEDIEEHLDESIHTGTDPLFPDAEDIEYTLGDKIITGAAEEDVGTRPLRHFWDPDEPEGGEYDDGLYFYTSSYDKARTYWLAYVVPLYVEGDKERSFYWLGRVAHLLEDASVPAHVHKDNHFPIGENTDILEEFTASIFHGFNGNAAGDIYKYEDLPNMDSFDWGDVDSDHAEVRDLFRLFWYTAQKTQYYASNDKDGNSEYFEVNGAGPISFSPSLWSGDGVTIVADKDDVTNNIDEIQDAVVPHAMRATAGLYRLFWDSVHIDWPFFHHDLQRTGFTHLRGDLRTYNLEDNDITLDSNDDFISRISIADLDSNGLQEAVVTTFKQDVGGKVYAVEQDDNDNVQIKWSYDAGETLGSPAISDVISDTNKEVIYSTSNGKLQMLKVSASGTSVTKQTLYTLPKRFDPDQWVFARGNIRNTAIADLDHDGNKEIIFVDFREYTTENWPARLHVLNRYGNLIDSYTVGNGGANGPVSIANIDNDPNLEIIVPTSYAVKAFDYNSQDLSQKWSVTNGTVTGSAVIADYDRDSDLDVIYVTTDASTICEHSCSNSIHIRDAKTGAFRNRILLGQLDTQITPAVANIDTDSRLEIVIAAKNNDTTDVGVIKAYDSVTGNEEWSYDDSGNLEVSTISPDIADIDGFGDMEVIYAENNDNNVYILEDDGTLWAKYSFSGTLGSALAIGDLDNDRRAEIAVKHAGSPITVFSYVTAENNAPILSNTSDISDLSYEQGEIVDISSLVNASDFNNNATNNDTVNIVYEPPFNSSGQWDVNCSIVGKHLTFVEAIDENNLSDILPIEVEIEATCPTISPVDTVTAIEGEDVVITVVATDPNNDSLTYSINDTSFTQNGNNFTWITQAGDSGNYTFTVGVTDSNSLHVTEEVDVKIFVLNSQLENTFASGNPTELLTFNTPSEVKSVSLRLPKDASILYTTLQMEGLSP